MSSYRFHCKNARCGSEFLRYYPVEEFEAQQYGSGWACFNCGFPRMAVIKSNKAAKDSFAPGFQRNIRKHCSTYSQYKQELKNMGLIEIGYEELPPEDEDTGFQDYWTEDILRDIYDDGISLDGELVKGLQSGKVTM